MAITDNRRYRPSFWSRALSLFRHTPETFGEWHWHEEQMRRQLPDGRFVYRKPTEEELFDKVERQAW